MRSAMEMGIISIRFSCSWPAKFRIRNLGEACGTAVRPTVRVADDRGYSLHLGAADTLRETATLTRASWALYYHSTVSVRGDDGDGQSRPPRRMLSWEGSRWLRSPSTVVVT